MGFLSVVGNSFGCSAYGERLVSAAREGDLQEAKALLECNPRLAKYYTFNVRNSPLHYSAAHGHNDIVTLLIESGVDINMKNYRGQTALMQASQHGHWEVVLTLMLCKANINKADYLNGGTALHLAALNGHSQCIRLLLADHVPSIPNCWDLSRKKPDRDESASQLDDDGLSVLHKVINRPADGGLTPLHMAALNGHFQSVQLLLDLGASATQVTVEDGSKIDFIGPGSSALHYAACGGNSQCCRILIAHGASLTAKNGNGWSPLMVARSWHTFRFDETLNAQAQLQWQASTSPSPYFSLPLKSIIKIARESGRKNDDVASGLADQCCVCLERPCMVAAEGCGHAFCVWCALYLCCAICTSLVARASAPGSLPCPLCRHGIVSFLKLQRAKPATVKTIAARRSFSVPCCTVSGDESETIPLCKRDFHCAGLSPLPLSSPLPQACAKFSSRKFSIGCCRRSDDTSPSLIPSPVDRNPRDHLVQ